MAWAAGAFSRIFGATGWVDDKNAATNILSSRHDTHDQDLADGINACLTRDNQSKPTADFLPASSATFSIGSSGVKWLAGYFSGDLSANNMASGSFVLALTGFSAGGSATCDWYKAGNIVAIQHRAALSGISNSASMGAAAGALPAAIRPASGTVGFCPCGIYNNGSVEAGYISFTSGGAIGFYRADGTPGTFTPSGVKGSFSAIWIYSVF